MPETPMVWNTIHMKKDKGGPIRTAAYHSQEVWDSIDNGVFDAGTSCVFPVDVLSVETTESGHYYTVFGIYADNNQRFGHFVRANDPDDAEMMASVYAEHHQSSDVLIACVLEGLHAAADTKEFCP